MIKETIFISTKNANQITMTSGWVRDWTDDWVDDWVKARDWVDDVKDWIKDKVVPRAVPLPPYPPIIFPLNPDYFNPRGLIKNIYPTPNNGMIYKWGVDAKTTIFEWHENTEFSNGPHYHINPLSDMYEALGYDDGEQPHFYAGNIIPEPWATLYFRW